MFDVKRSFYLLIAILFCTANSNVWANHGNARASHSAIGPQLRLLTMDMVRQRSHGAFTPGRVRVLKAIGPEEQQVPAWGFHRAEIHEALNLAGHATLKHLQTTGRLHPEMSRTLAGFDSFMTRLETFAPHSSVSPDKPNTLVLQSNKVKTLKQPGWERRYNGVGEINVFPGKVSVILRRGAVPQLAGIDIQSVANLPLPDSHQPQYWELQVDSRRALMTWRTPLATRGQDKPHSAVQTIELSRDASEAFRSGRRELKILDSSGDPIRQIVHQLTAQ